MHRNFSDENLGEKFMEEWIMDDRAIGRRDYSSNLNKKKMTLQLQKQNEFTPVLNSSFVHFK